MARRAAVAGIAAAVLLLPATVATTARAEAPTPPPPPPGVRDLPPLQFSQDTDTIIVTFERGQRKPEAAAADVIEEAAGAVADAVIVDVTPITDTTVAVRLDQAVSQQDAARIGEEAAAAHDQVRAAEPAGTLAPAATSDAYYSYLWNLRAGSPSGYGVNAEAAWPTSAGEGTVVGVLDTGITAHPDLAGNVVSGYDFITKLDQAGDGDGWDADPTDPGDFCTERSEPSSWHGTHVAGIVAAVRDNGLGVVGVAPAAKIQPLRVLGRCGGLESDIVAAIRWGVGLPVNGLPANPTPADVLNLSLGGVGTCTVAMQDAINAAVAAGVPVVVATGNQNVPLGTTLPANCAKVIRVTASTFEGQRAPYSNYGTTSYRATIAAPGGSGRSQFTLNDWILSTWVDDSTEPDAPAYVPMVGTSMAAPHVSAVAALLKAEKPDLTPAQVQALLVESATSLPGCTTTSCGAGVVHAERALRALAAADVLDGLQVPEVSGVAQVGQRLATAGSGADGADYSYQWLRNGTPISGATAPSRLLTENDKGAVISVRTTASYLGFTRTKTSTATGKVALGRFRITVAPQISGSFTRGATLKASRGTWSPTPTTVKYRWLRNGSLISGATSSTYTLTSSDRGKDISVRITGYRAGYIGANAYSSRHRVR